jgi:putative ABC transport system substrate-binding protein
MENEGSTGTPEALSMSTRRSFLIASTLGASAFAMRLRAESSKRAKRVGIVYPEPPGDADQRRGWAAFDQEMRDLGWEEGRNIIFERRYFHGDRTRLPGLMAELIALDVDVFFVQGSWAVLAAKQATDRIPIIFGVGDAVGRGLVANLARPEANATGVSNRFVEANAKLVELLAQASPGVSRVAAFMNTALGYPPALFQTPRPRGVEVFIVDLKGPQDIGEAMATVAKRHANGIAVVQGLKDPFQVDLVEAIAKLRLPAVFPGRRYVQLGGLLSFGWNLAYNFRRIAVYIDKILHGAKPADLPVEQPAVFELAINLKTAKALGITIPRELLLRADWIVE